MLFAEAKLERIALTEVWIIIDIMQKPNPIIVLHILYIERREKHIKRSNEVCEKY